MCFKSLFGNQNKEELEKCQTSLETCREGLAGCLVEKTQLQERNDELESENASLNYLLNPPKTPTAYAEIPGNTVRLMLQEAFPQYHNKIFVSDSKYKITAQSELRRFIEWDNVNIFPYVSQWHDCDDFAFALNGDFAKYPGWSGYPVAMVWADYGIGAHAFVLDIAWESLNIMEPCIYYIEPQNDHEIAAESMEDATLMLLVV